MSVFTGSGILLNPFIVTHPRGARYVFRNSLAKKATNRCALRDELGAIAYALNDIGHVDVGKQMFSILGSDFTLTQRKKDIFRCLQYATTEILTQALIRSGRYFEQSVENALHSIAAYRGSLKTGNKYNEKGVAAALAYLGSFGEAAHVLGVSTSWVSRIVRDAALDSVLAIYKGAFRQGVRREKIGDDEIAEALARFDTIKDAAKFLGLTRQSLSYRVINAKADSILDEYKGVFKPGFGKRA